MDNRWIIALGPTASGKTRLAIELALRVGGEIVSADSMQVYRGLDIGTAKPTEAEKRGVPHHMIDALDFDQPFSVAAYREMALKCVEDIRARGRIPIVAGGTGLYIDSLVTDMDYGRAIADPSLRERLAAQAAADGLTELHKRLQSCDPKSAQRIHPNDAKRIIRALEVYEICGEPLSQINERRALPEARQPLYIGLTMERRALYERIDARVDRMIEDGLVEEARGFFARGEIATAAQALGYKQLFGFFRGQWDLPHAVDAIKRETRRYAKRQITYFKRNERVHWLDALAPDLIEQALTLVKAHGI